MNNAKRVKDKESEMVENEQNGISAHKKMQPFEEYSQTVKIFKKKNRFIAIVFLIEFLIYSFFIMSIDAYDLHYRVTKEVENSITGENKFLTGVYTGETDFGYFIGDGTFEYKTGTVYVGTWKDNYMQGKGILNIPDEGIYEGEEYIENDNGEYIHYECPTVREMVEFLGYEVQVMRGDSY